MTNNPTKTIPEFYAGQSIFLTGVTGFLGKVFIEKVLRSCPDVREIFLLIRPKRELSVNERLEKILSLPLFEKLREEQPSNFKKLVPISGDVSEKELGISVADRKMLIERVTIIIHTAASVRFNDSLKYAIFTNTRGTRDICILGQKIKNLIALVYVSTAFAHVNERIIEEKIYPPVADWQKIIKIAELLDEHTLNVFMAKCLNYAPNTYIFSKNLAESIIQEYSSFLPCAIIRPSIVLSTEKEPMPGWADNAQGYLGLHIAGGKGILKVACMAKDTNTEFVPLDIVIKTIIVTVWKIGLTTFTASTPFIVNCTSQKYISHQDVINMSSNIVINEVPFEGTIWIPHAILTDNLTLFFLLTVILHILPALLIDLGLKFSGRQPMLLQLQRRIYATNRAVCYFAIHDWKYSNTNNLFLTSLIPPENQDTFSLKFDTDFVKYIKNCVIGVKKYILHEDMNRLDAARAHNRRIYLFATVVKTIISIGILWIVYKWIYSYIL